MQCRDEAARVVERLSCHYVPPSRWVPDSADDVRVGLLSAPRSLPPKYFYDARGSRLFDAICDTPEYYPTRTENALLRRCACDIIGRIRSRHIVELGGGAARKTRHLFDACARTGCLSSYASLDVCKEMLLETGRSLTAEYEWLDVTALVGDYHAGLDGLPRAEGSRLFVFLGGTIGNFTATDAVVFLSELRAGMGPGDWLLLGADRVKDSATLNAAYNDSAGITAAFNLNLLDVMNKALNANFEPDAFRHLAFFNASQSQIEMYLVSQCAQVVEFRAMGEFMNLADGERIRTEISRKFTHETLDDMLSRAGLTLTDHYLPDNRYFSLVLARPA